jgi:hypothetical protein
MTYRWYKIMSPSIDLTVQSVGMHTTNLLIPRALKKRGF